MNEAGMGDGRTGAAEAAPRSRHDRWRVLRTVLLAVLGTVVLGWAVLYVTRGRFLKHPFERVVGSMTGRTVRVAGDFNLYFAPFRLRFMAEGFSLSNPRWATTPHLFRADRIDSRIAPLSLLFGRMRIHALDLDGGVLGLERRADGMANSWTFDDDGGGGDPVDLPVVDRAVVYGTRVIYRDPPSRLAFDIRLDTVRSRDARIGEAIRFGGTGRVRDTPMRVAGALLSPDETLGRGRNRLVLAADGAGNRITATGDLPSLTGYEGVPLAVSARGVDMARLFGIIGVAVPQTRAYRLAATMVKTGTDYRFTDLAGRFGDSDLTGTVAVQAIRPRTHIAADIVTRSLAIADAAPVIGYNPDLVARAGARAAVSQPGGTPRLLPDARLRVEALANFDADLRWRVGRVVSDAVPIRDASLVLDLDDRRLSLSPVRFEMARGRIAADIVIDARERPALTRYDVLLAPTPMGRLLAGFGVEESGTSGTMSGRLRLVGRGDTVRDSLASADGRIAFVMPAGSFWTRNVELSELDIGTFVQKMFERKLEEPVRINCGLIAFTVRRGVAAADPILIDTRKNVILGRGGFSFRDERLDLAFRADSKRFSLFSGQSPVALRGAFAAPAIDAITPELLGRAGAGLGLAALAAPPAALLAFVDPGDAQAAACGPILRGARASAQRTADGEARDDVGPDAPKERPRRRFLGIF